MKKTFTLIISCVLIINVNAQFQKGNKVLGFGLDFTSDSREQNYSPSIGRVKSNLVNISTEFGFAKAESRVNGFYLNLGYGVANTEYVQPSIYTTKSQTVDIGLGYFVRKYMPLANRFYVFGEGSAGAFYSANYFSKLKDPYFQRFGASISIKPGLAYKLKERFLLELRFADLANIGYTQQEARTGVDNKNVDRHFNIGSRLGLGYLNNIGIGARWIIK